METERCTICGASVKKENLKGHYQRVHPKRSGSLVKPKGIEVSRPVFRSHRRRNILVLSLIVLTVIGVSAVAAQFVSSNTERMHIHPQLSITINGSPMMVPQNIGINQDLWIDHSLDRYGLAGLSPLHTHDTSGTIHVESNTVRDFALQEFLAVWGKHLDSGQVMGNPVGTGHRAYLVVDGVEQPSGIFDVTLKDGMKIEAVLATTQ